MNEHRTHEPRTPVESNTTENEPHCPECDGTELIVDVSRGETVCQDCGTVVEERVVDRGPEWREFDDQDRARVGAPVTTALHDKGLTTSIDWRNKDSSGQLLPPRRRKQLQRLRAWQERIRVQDATERNLQYALSEINRMTSALGVSDRVRDMSAVIYRRALEEDLIRGRSIEGMATGAFYAACRKDGVPRSLDEISSISRVEKCEIGRAYRYLVQELDLKMVPVSPKTYVPRFCSELDLSEAVQRSAIQMIETAADVGLQSGKSPPGFAGAAIYLAAEHCGDPRYQSDIADIANVTDVTIRTHYTDLKEYLESEDAYPDCDD